MNSFRLAIYVFLSIGAQALAQTSGTPLPARASHGKKKHSLMSLQKRALSRRASEPLHSPQPVYGAR